MNFFKKQLLHHRLRSIFVDIRNNAFLLSGFTVRTLSTVHCAETVTDTLTPSSQVSMLGQLIEMALIFSLLQI